MATGSIKVPFAISGNVTVTNLNDLITTGVYEYADTASNKPTDSNGGVVFCLFHWGEQGMQLARPNNVNAIYVRKLTGTTWTSWVKMMSGLQFIDDEITVSFASGTIGTRGFQKKLDTQIPSGKYIAGAVVTYISDSEKVIPIVFASYNDLYLNCYRATSAAVSNVTVRVRFTVCDN